MNKYITFLLLLISQNLHADYATCTTDWQITTTAPECTTNLQIKPTPTNNNKIVICPTLFQVSTGGWLYCATGMQSINYSDINNYTDNNYFELSDATLVGGFIQNPTSLISSNIETITTNTSTTSLNDYQLNSEFIQLMYTTSFYFFAFGLFFGGIISLIRKTAHK